MTKYTVETTEVPGGAMIQIGQSETISDARKIAAKYEHRRDLRYSDVAIFCNGVRVEMAGPCR